MSKKGRRRHKQRRQKPTSRVLEAPGLRVEQRGRLMITEVNRTPEQQDKVQEGLHEAALKLPGDIVAKAIVLRDLLLNYEAFDVLGAIATDNLLINPEAYREVSHKGLSFFVEYAALLLLTRSYSHGRHAFLEPEVPTQINRLLRELLDDTIMLMVAKSQPSEDVPPELAELQFAARMNALVVRNPAYPHHLEQVLQDLFDPFEETLVAKQGCSARDAFAVSTAAADLIEERFSHRVGKAAEATNEMLAEVREFRRTGRRAQEPPEKGLGTDQIAALARLRPRDAKRRLGALASHWILIGLGDVFAFPVAELAAAAGLPVERAAKVCVHYSLGFGEVSDEDLVPTATHPLKRRPLLTHEGRICCPVPGLMDWAVQAGCEETLKSAGDNVWQRYVQHRHSCVLKSSMGLLQKLMPEAQFYTNLYYAPSDDPAARAELDGMVLFDTCLLLLEAKGADLTAPAHRGAVQRLKRDLEATVGEAHGQAVRALAFIESAPEVVFTGQGGTVPVRQADYRESFLISPSLAPLGHLTAVLHATTPLGLFKQDRFSWMVSLYDLMVIADILDFPPMFPHYVRRRVRTGRQGLVSASDELDLFSHYLKEGLYFPQEKGAAPSEVQLASYTTDFDDYYSFKRGQRTKPAPKPAQRMLPAFRNLLVAVNAGRHPGYVDVCLALLDLSTAGRKQLVRMIAQVSERSISERRPVDATLMGRSEGGWGITYIRGADPREVDRLLRSYCPTKRGQQGLRRWFGIGDTGSSSHEICSIMII